MTPDDPERPGWRPQLANPISAEECQRLARAYAAKRPPAPAPPPVPTVRATSADPCPRCEVPGFRGCAHQLPYERPVSDGRANKYGPRMSTAWGHTRK